MTTDEESPIIRTTSKRMGQGLAIIAIVMAVGAAIAIPNWHNMAKNPPPASSIQPKPGSESLSSGTLTSINNPNINLGPATPAASKQPSAPVAGAVTITILQGASTQGNPAFSPTDTKVPIDGKVVWQNKDNVPHTATSGTGPSDSNSGKIFDTKIINNGESSTAQVLKGAKVGDVVPYYCQIHPYMTGKITVTASAVKGGASSAVASSGAALSILQGASIQGNPAYDPSVVKVKKGSVIQVTNKDSVPHTVTNGKGADDPNVGKLFDTSIINAGESAKIDTSKLSVGQEYPFHCTVHPYMTGTLKVT
jgi:plastocyanin